MSRLILLRHFKSQWNLENRFTGWVDVPLSKKGILETREILEKLGQFDIIYSSPLIRNKETVLKILENYEKYPIFIHLDKGKMRDWAKFEGEGNYIPVYISENLNERFYGRLQGLNKDELKKRYGEEKVKLWRRSYNIAPPGGESLKEVVKRVVPFYKKYIEKELKKGKNVLVVASHNSLRALVKYLEKISDNDIINLEIPYGGIIEYKLDQSLKLIQRN